MDLFANRPRLWSRRSYGVARKMEVPLRGGGQGRTGVGGRERLASSKRNLEQGLWQTGKTEPRADRGILWSDPSVTRQLTVEVPQN